MITGRKTYDCIQNQFIVGRRQASRPTSYKTPKDLNDVGDKMRLIGDDLAMLKGECPPTGIDFQNIVTTSTLGSPQQIALNHGLSSSVRHCLLDVNAASVTSPVFPGVNVDTSTTNNTLVLNVVFSGSFTVRVEPAQ